MAVVTISRQYGSGGDAIAARVCELLGYYYFDKRLMARVAFEAGLTEGEIIDFSEDNYKIQSFLDRLFRRRTAYTVDQLKTWSGEFVEDKGKEEITLDEASTLALVQGAIKAAYNYGKVVIVGRGGQAILQDIPGVLHVRIVAPLDARVQRLHKRENFSFGGAQDRAINRDRAAADYLRRFYHVDWADPTLYNLIINTGRLEIEAAAQLIAKAVDYLPSTEQPSE